MNLNEDKMDDIVLDDLNEEDPKKVPTEILIEENIDSNKHTEKFDEEKIVISGEAREVDEITIINRKRKKLPRLCKKKKRELVPRDVHINNPSKNSAQGFESNFAKTYKYNAISFVPVFLFEQFTRVANAYFLIISVLQLIPGLSPTGRFTTLATLIFVLTVNGIKDALEDLQRHRQDRIVNTRKIEVVRGGQFVEIEWQDLQVGDIVRLMNDAFIPADIIVLSSSDEKNSRCYIETSNMDGESDYKPRKGLVDTAGFRDLQSISKMRGVVKAEAPNKTITHFSATIHLEGSKEGKPLSQEHLLYRGASLKNTDWVFGLVIYTGNDTKLVLNSKKPKLKRSNVERKLNLYIFAIFTLLLLLIIICTIGYGAWSKNYAEQSWYLMLSNSTIAKDTFVAFLSFFILYGGYLVPISLYVTIELVKVWQAFYINSDLMMYHAPNDTPALTRSSGLTEELGQVHYIFSDKTGTLTQNQMQFRKCSIGGVKYGLGYTEISLAKAKKEKQKIEERVIRKDSELEDKYVNYLDNNYLDKFEPTSLWNELKAEDTDRIIDEYFKCLALCHTIIPQDKKEGKYEKFYQSASPDEAALVRAARYFGYELMDRNDEIITYKNKGEIYKFKPLQIIEFSSKRKRMSVMVQDLSNKKIYLYAKGADDVIFDRLDKTVDQPLRKPTTEHLEEFGNDGLRTLAIGYREVPADFYNDWSRRWNELEKIVGERSKVEKEKEMLAEEIEVSLTLLGATALEDKLQEGVPDAIESLLGAGIKMWVLTGDKLETAINISFACSLLDDSMDIMEIDYEWPKNILTKSQIEEEEKKAENFVSEKINQFLERLEKKREKRRVKSQNKKVLNLENIRGDEDMHQKQDRDYDETESSEDVDHNDPNAVEQDNLEKDNLALVISGLALKYALSPHIEDKFEKLSRSCKSVVCCRVSPAQKAEVVSLVKRKQTIISLAIGDGANDVSMIQEAHVGVGINGEEGSQASRTADFAIAQFRFLVPLLLFHGRYSYRRISKLIQYSFYKNCVLTMTQFWFCLVNAFTGQNLYEQWTLSVFNVVFASLPVITFAILDEDVGKDFVLKNPKLYVEGQRNSLFTPMKFITWMVNAILQSIIICFLSLGIFYHDVIHPDGRNIGMYGTGLVIYTCVIFVITLKIAMESYRWVWFHHVVVWGSLASFFVWNAIYAVLYEASALGPEYYFVFYRLLSSPVFYFSVLLITATSILPSYTYIFIRRTYAPRNHHLIAEMEKIGKIITIKKKKQERRQKRKEQTKERKPRRYKGFAFTQGITTKVLNEEISTN